MPVDQSEVHSNHLFFLSELHHWTLEEESQIRDLDSDW